MAALGKSPDPPIINSYSRKGVSMDTEHNFEHKLGYISSFIVRKRKLDVWNLSLVIDECWQFLEGSS